MPSSAPEPPGAVDVDRLMADLKVRVDARRRAGGYDRDLLDMPFDEDLALGGGGGPVRLRPETAYSSKPVVGRAITLAKQAQIRGMYHFLQDVVTQTNSALVAMRAALEAESRYREALEERVSELEEELDAEREAREGPGPG